MKVHIINIEWDIPETENYQDMAKEYKLPEEVEIEADSIEGLLDELSLDYGFLIRSYNYGDMYNDILNALSEEDLIDGIFASYSANAVLNEWNQFEEEHAYCTDNERERFLNFIDAKRVTGVFTQITDDTIYIVDNKGNEFLLEDNEIKISKGIFLSEDFLFEVVNTLTNTLDIYDLQYMD